MGRNASLAEVEAPRRGRPRDRLPHLFAPGLRPGRRGRAPTPTSSATARPSTQAGLPEPATFAYPYGDVSVPAKRALAERFALLRGLHHGLIDDARRPQPGARRSASRARTARPSPAAGWTRPSAARAWLILYTHDVCDSPSAWGCTPAALGRPDRARLRRGLRGGHRRRRLPPHRGASLSRARGDEADPVQELGRVLNKEACVDRTDDALAHVQANVRAVPPVQLPRRCRDGLDLG